MFFIRGKKFSIADLSAKLNAPDGSVWAEERVLLWHNMNIIAY